MSAPLEQYALLSDVHTAALVSESGSLLQLAHIGYLAYDDERMLKTVACLEKDLVEESGFPYRYRTQSGADGLDGDEYPFLICTFWLIEQ